MQVVNALAAEMEEAKLEQDESDVTEERISSLNARYIWTFIFCLFVS